MRLTFPDRLVRELDLDRLLQGGIFGSLRDPAAFAKVIVDEVADTWRGRTASTSPLTVLHGDHSPATGSSPLAPRGYTL